MARAKQIYKIIFHNQGKIYEIHAKQVNASNLLGFVEVEGLLFGATGSGVLVDPSEERLKAEFADVKRTYIPMQAVVRIDEVEKGGVNKIIAVSDKSDNVTAFPASVFTTQRDKS
jgi:hypothetical protein